MPRAWGIKRGAGWRRPWPLSSGQIPSIFFSCTFIYLLHMLSCAFLKKIYKISKSLFIYGCTGPWLLHRLSLAMMSGGYSLVAMLRLLSSVASLVEACGLQELRLHSCGA